MTSTAPVRLSLLSDSELDTLDANVNAIIDAAEERKMRVLPPTLEDFVRARETVLAFVKSNKRIVYGGYAWNALIKAKDPADAFYSEKHMADIEFYSNRPAHDIKALCDALHADGFEYVSGKNAFHEDTFTVFVNFKALCDISYMPSNIYFNTPTVSVDGLRLAHPKFIMVDVLRIFNTPLTSYFRIEKTLNRVRPLLKHYQLVFSSRGREEYQPVPVGSLPVVETMMQTLRKLDVMYVGHLVLPQFFKPGVKMVANAAPVEVYSSNLAEDAKAVHDALRDVSDVTTTQYYPFFQFWDKSVVFKHQGTTILTMYGNLENCLGYLSTTLDGRPIKTGSFNTCFMHELVRFHHGYVQRNDNVKRLADYNMLRMLVAKKLFLKREKKTILDDTVFRDFSADCYGATIEPIRKRLLSTIDDKYSRVVINYTPRTNSNFNPDNINFGNYSGNIINNPKDTVHL